MKSFFSFCLIFMMLLTGFSGSDAQQPMSQDANIDSYIEDNITVDDADETTKNDNIIVTDTLNMPLLDAPIHEHEYFAVTTDATCDEDGVIIYTCDCGDEYQEIIPATGHIWSDWNVTASAACETDGEQTRFCQVCGIEETEILPKSGHQYVADVVAEIACESDGYTVFTCSECGDQYEEKISATGHTWSNWTVTTVAACEKAGEEIRSCAVCGLEETRTVAALKHNFGDSVVIKNATCTEAGLTRKTCSLCGAVEEKSIKTLGHDFSETIETIEATCTKAGTKTIKCSRCEETKTESLSKLGHNYGEWTVKTPATCVETGTKISVCSRCGDEKIKDIAKVSHNYGEWTVKTAATCDKDGVEISVCTICGQEKTKSVKKLGHNYGEWTVKTAATCDKDGVDSSVCTVCGQEKTKSTKKLGHDFQYSSTTNATTKNEGYKLYLCSRCNQEKKETIARLSAVDTDMCGESLLGKPLPHGLFPEFTAEVFERWNAKYSIKDNQAAGHIYFNDVAYKEKVLWPWYDQYRYLCCSYAVGNCGANQFYAWVTDQDVKEQEAVYKNVAKILKELKIDKNVTQKEAIIRINDWLCKNKEYAYDTSVRDPSLYYSIFSEKLVCHNYALAFQVLCLGAGIECHYYSSDAMNHAWNKVYFSDDTYLWVDACWNDTTSKPSSYLLITTDQLLKDHVL